MNTYPNIQSPARGYAAAVFSAVFLSTTAIFIRHLTLNYEMPALVLAFWRNVFVSLTLLAGLGAAYPALLRVAQASLRYLLIYGLVLAFFNAFWTLSVAMNGAAVATVLAYSSAAFTALLGWWLLKEALNWARLAAVVLCLTGCALVAGVLVPGAWQANLAGILTGILAGLFYAIYSLMGRSAAQRGLNPWTTLFYTFSFAGIFLLTANLLPLPALTGAAARPADLLWLSSAFAGWGMLFLLAAGPTVAGFGLYNISLSHLPSSVANLIVTLEPAFTAVMAYLFFGERLTPIQIAGSILILSGVLLLRIFEGRPHPWRRRRAAVEPAEAA